MANKSVPSEIAVDSLWVYGDRTLRIMGIVEGYVVYRFKGAGAAMMYWSDFVKRFRRRADSGT